MLNKPTTGPAAGATEQDAWTVRLSLDDAVRLQSAIVDGLHKDALHGLTPELVRLGNEIDRVLMLDLPSAWSCAE